MTGHVAVMASHSLAMTVMGTEIAMTQESSLLVFTLCPPLGKKFVKRVLLWSAPSWLIVSVACLLICVLRASTRGA